MISSLLSLLVPLLADLNQTGVAQMGVGLPPSEFNTEVGKTGDIMTEAISEASHFLNLIDQRQYGAAWRDAGYLFKDCITEEQWVGAMQRTRRPLGNLRSRKVTLQELKEQLPYGTRGYFAIIRYDSQFSAASSSQEEIYLMRDALGQFRAIHYSVTGG